VDSYDDAANSCWERLGRATIERLGLKPRARARRVLRERCVGDPAAERVGPDGSVLGVDRAS
jgi:hypothetical protein